MPKHRLVSVRFVQSRACPAILAAFRDGVGIKLTMSGKPRDSWDRGPGEAPIGTRFNANDQYWRDIDPARADEARVAFAALFGKANVMT